MNYLTNERLRQTLTVMLAIVVVGYHLYLIFTGLIPNLVSRPIHLALALPWVYVINIKATGRLRYTGYVLACAGMFGCFYIAAYRDMLVEQYGFLEGPYQYIIAIALILAVLEMARRAIKLALPLVAVIALLYGFGGQYVPGEFGHPGLPAGSLLGTLVIAEGGLWGPLTGISVNVVAVFVILGAFINAGEGGNAFMALATKLAGRLRAGSAKVSVLSSAFFGSISGSASANVASTGAVTIPAMKKLGCPASLAASVEAVASSGGQIMPPLMGAGAFVMTELLRVNYTVIMSAALLPALLFFFAAWVGVDRYAERYDLRAMATDQIPSAREVAQLAPFFLIPFGLLLGILFLTGRTPQYGAGVAIFSAILLLAPDAKLTFSIKRFMQRVQDGMMNAAEQIAVIASVIICAGLVIGVLQMTGLGVKVTSVIIALSGGNVTLALLLTALACLILGMEVPTTAAYVICVAVAGPALEKLGLPALHVHLFVFWYALLSTITPPVCGTVFIAAGMADAPWVAVANHAMRLGLGLYLVPLAFIVNPALIHPDTGIMMAIAACVKIGLGLWLFSRCLIGGDFWSWKTPLELVGGSGVIFLFGIG